MRTIRYILKKEFTQIRRDKRMVAIIVMVPVIQMLILVYAATFDIKNVEMIVCDYDVSTSSKQLIQKFEASPFFQLEMVENNDRNALDYLETDKAELVVVIPEDFEGEISKGGEPVLQLLVNAINGSQAEIAYSYCVGIIQKYNVQVRSEWLGMNPSNSGININERYWYNSELDYKHYMAPGILVILVTVIGMFLSGMNLVKEKEVGTIEQINVTPIKSYQLIVGKLVPFWVIALIDLGLGLLIARIAFHLPFEGSLLVLFSYAAIYLFGVLSFGLLLSVISDRQQQVMFVGFFFMIVMILMGGIFTSAESMPYWAQTINKANPVYYFIQVTRSVLLKGSGFGDLIPHFGFAAIFGVLMLAFSVLIYRKRA